MANLLCGGWTDSELKNTLASFGLTLLLFLACVAPSTAQVERVERPHRRVVRSSEPDYPNIVKHAHIGGSVRLNVTVLSSGDVAKVDNVGGNPKFTESLNTPFLMWYYVPGS